ncbi:hypothetical protein QL285_015528 [Trifolium repens]|nr:hypothetical protein QL285_015528 [Trifolium repens]
MHFTFTGYRLLEEGGTMFTFEGTGKNCSPKSVLRVHNPQFYWKAVFLNVVSGLTLTETLGDLAIAAAIYSSIYLRNLRSWVKFKCESQYGP